MGPLGGEDQKPECHGRHFGGLAVSDQLGKSLPLVFPDVMPGPAQAAGSGERARRPAVVKRGWPRLASGPSLAGARAEGRSQREGRCTENKEDGDEQELKWSKERARPRQRPLTSFSWLLIEKLVPSNPQAEERKASSFSVLDG